MFCAKYKNNDKNKTKQRKNRHTSKLCIRCIAYFFLFHFAQFICGYVCVCVMFRYALFFILNNIVVVISLEIRARVLYVCICECLSIGEWFFFQTNIVCWKSKYYHKHWEFFGRLGKLYVVDIKWLSVYAYDVFENGKKSIDHPYKKNICSLMHSITNLMYIDIYFLYYM